MWNTIAKFSSTALWAATALGLSACQPPAFVAALGGSSPSLAASSVTSSSVASSPVNPANEDPCANQPRKDPSVVGSESYNQGNNSPFSAKADPEPTACDIARENGHKWTRLVGYSIDEATKRAKGAGWEKKIVVREMSEYDAKCKEGTVCSLDPARWEIGDGYELTLRINRKMNIAAPE